MADVWTNPKTWGAEVATSADQNTYVRDNETALKNALEGDAGAALVHRHKSGTLAARPAAGQAGREYFATDVGRTYFDDGTVWWETPLLDDGATAAADEGDVLRIGATGPEWGPSRIVVRKSATESVANSTTLQNDDELIFPVAANETWVVEYVLFGSADSTVPGIKVALSVPSGAAGRMGAIGASFTPAASGTQTSTLTAGLSMPVDVGFMVHFFATIRNGANAGNVTLQWAQQVSNANAVRIMVDSYLIARPVT